jgi:hypothetical protein
MTAQSMSVCSKYASVESIGYSVSQRINSDFLMGVPLSGLDPRSPDNVRDVRHMVDTLESIGITLVSQLFESEGGMLFIFLEELTNPHVLPTLKNVIHLIRGGPRLDYEFFKSIQRPGLEFYTHRKTVYRIMRQALIGMGILYTNQFIGRDNYLLYTQLCLEMKEIPKHRVLYFFETMLDTAREGY